MTEAPRTSRVREIIFLIIFLGVAFVYFFHVDRATGVVALLVLLSLGVFFYVLYKKMLQYDVLPRASKVFRLSILDVLVIALSVTIVCASALLISIFRLPDIPTSAAIVSSMLNVASVFLVYGALTTAFYLIGDRVIRWSRLAIEDEFGRMLYSFAFGISIVIFYFYLVSLLHLLTPWSLVLFMIIVALTTRSSWAALWHSVRLKRFSFVASADFRIDGAARSALCLVLLLFFVFAFINASGLFPISFDDVRTYYNVPKVFLEQGGIVDFPYEPTNNGPQAFAYIYIPIMMFGHSFLNYAVIYFFLLVLLFIWNLGSNIFGKKEGILAATLFAMLPWTVWFLVTAKVDFIATYFVLLGVQSIFIYFDQQKNERWLAVSGLLLSVAAAIKYTALLALPGVAALLVVHWILKRAPFFQIAKASSVVCLFLILGLAPWIIRNQIVWGEPLYPYAVSGELLWREELSPAAKALHKEIYTVANSVGHAFTRWNPWWKNLAYLVSSPTQYTANRTGPLFFGLLPLIFLFKPRGREARYVVYVFAFIATTVVAWLSVVKLQVWYMMFIYPLWTIIAAFYFSRLRSHWVKMMIVCVLLIVGLTRLNTTRVFLVQFLPGYYDTVTYLSPYGFALSLSSYFNTVIAKEQPNYLLFPMGQQRNILFADNFKHIYGKNIFLNDWTTIVADTESGEEALNALKERGITHVYYVFADMNSWQGIWCRQSQPAASCQSFQKLLERFHETSALMRVKAQTDEWIIYEII